MISLEKLPKGLILYGAGFLAPDFVHFLKKHKKNIKLILDQKFGANDEFLDIPARSLESYSLNLKAIQNAPVIITIVRKDLKDEIKNLLLKKGVKQIYWMFELEEYQAYLKSFLLKKNEERGISTQKFSGKLGVILHLYYEDLLEEIIGFLKNIKIDFDLFISVCDKSIIMEILKKLEKSLPQALPKVYLFSNKGRDILPFLKILKNLKLKDYKAILKIHTKKSLHLNLGDVWRRQLYTRLLGTSSLVAKVLNLFENEKDMGILAPAGYLYPLKWYSANAEEKFLKLFKFFKLSVCDFSGFYFPAGSMFWFKPEVFKPLQSIDFRKVRFEKEKGQVDGTWAHAFERFFGILPAVQGYKVVQIDEEGKVYEAS